MSGSNTRAWLKKKLLRKRVLLPLIGIGVPWLWIAWQCFGPLWPITISYETTRLTGPLTPDGRYVDYLGDARRRLEEPGAVAAKDDPWCILAGVNVSPFLYEHLKPQFPDFRPAFAAWLADHPEHSVDYGKSNGQNWRLAIEKFHLSGSSHPAIQKFLHDSRPWFEAVENSQPRLAKLECPPNETESYSSVLLRRSDLYRRRIVEEFSFRAALQFREGEFESAVRGMMLMFKASDFSDRFCTVGLGASWAIRRSVCEELIEGLALSNRIDEAICLELLQLPVQLMPSEDFVRLVSEEQRYLALDLIQGFHRQPEQFLQPAGLGVGVSQEIAARYAAHRVDFDKLLRLQNEISDQYAAAMRQPTYDLQMNAMPVLNYRMGNAKVISPEISLAFATADFQAQAELFVAQSFANSICVRLPEWIARQLNSRRVLHLATRLALWKHAHGRYPDTLAEVLTMPDLPAAPDRVLLDAFIDAPFHYQLIGDRYEIRSVGPDMELGTSPTDDDETWPSSWVPREEKAPADSENRE